MRENFSTEAYARLRTILVVGYALIIIYASLSPFTGWDEQGLNFDDVLRAPLKLTYTPFDAILNLLAYVPLGLLTSLVLREHFSLLVSILAGVVAGTLLSVSMEYLQMFLPARVSSNTDILSNSIGALLGALLAVSMNPRTWLFSRLAHWRSHMFQRDAEMDYGLALLVLWMFGQVNPTLPMLGNVFISEAQRQPFAAAPASHFNSWEASAVALNLVMLGALLLTLLRLPRRAMATLLAVLGIVAATKFFTAAILLKSWALLLWINSEAILGVSAGIVLIFLALHQSRNVVTGLGIFASLGYFCIVNFFLGENSPESAKSIYYWHYRHLLTYSGLAQTIALVFPLLLLMHLWRLRR